MTERYTQQEHEDHDNASVAVIRNDIKYMRADIKDIKDEIRQAGGLYVTKAEFMQFKGDLDKDEETRDKRISSIYAYGGTVLAIVTLALIGAIFKLILKV